MKYVGEYREPRITFANRRRDRPSGDATPGPDGGLRRTKNAHSDARWNQRIAAARSRDRLLRRAWGSIFSQIAWDQDLGRVRVDDLARYLRGCR